MTQINTKYCIQIKQCRKMNNRINEKSVNDDDTHEEDEF